MELEVAMIYANAMYGAAVDLGHVNEVREELKEIDRIAGKEKNFSDLMTNPAVSRTKKKEMIRNVFQGRALDEVVSFLCILADKGRLPLYHTIVRQYDKLVDEAEKCSGGLVYSVQPLSDERIQKLEEQAGKLLRKKVRLRNKLDPSLLGGVKILVDGKLIDLSFRANLTRMTDMIKKN